MKRGHCHSQLLEARVISRRKEASLRSFDLAGTIHFHNKATKVTKHRNRGSFDFFSGQAGHPVVTESAQWVGVVQPSQIFVSFVNFCSQVHTYGLDRYPTSGWPTPALADAPEWVARSLLISSSP